MRKSEYEIHLSAFKGFILRHLVREHNVNYAQSEYKTFWLWSEYIKP